MVTELTEDRFANRENGHLNLGSLISEHTMRNSVMEHRLDNRIQAPLNVTIHTDKGGTFPTHANNLSRGGVCVEMETAWDIKEKNLVLVEFREEQLATKIPALVIQTTGLSASLMFIEYSQVLHSFLSYRNR